MFEIKCPICNQICTGVSLFKSCNVWDFDLSWFSIVMLFFKLPWLVLTKWHETTRLTSYLPHSPSLALIYLSSFKLSVMKWLWLLSCFMEWEHWVCAVLYGMRALSVCCALWNESTECMLCFHHVFILLNSMCCAFFICILRGFFMLVFHNVIYQLL